MSLTLISLFISVKVIILWTSLSFSLLYNIISLIGSILFIAFISWQLVTVLIKYLLSNQRLNTSGRAVLITGCDTGFGYATAAQLRQNGWHVFAGVLQEHGEGAINLRDIECTTIKLDVTVDIDLINAYNIIRAECLASHLELWAVVNNAGVLVCGEIEWDSHQSFDHIFNINVCGYVRVIRQFLPLIRKSKGRIVNVSSVASIFTAPGMIAYSMSKSAISSLTDGLRRELSKTGVEVVEIVPDAYKTTMTKKAVLSHLDERWQNTTVEVKRYFGDQYYLAFRKYIAHNLNVARDKPEEVVNAMVDAVSLSRVNYKYMCCGPLNRIVIWIFEWMPIELIDFFIPMFTFKEMPNCSIN